MFDLALEFDICKKVGSWFSYGTEKLGQGKVNVENLLTTNIELFSKIEEEVMTKLKDPEFVRNKKK
ncbi:Recombinase A [Streptobacillus moniliformis]|nr:Recombinase A [Streptobacillus moniliformis]